MQDERYSGGMKNVRRVLNIRSSICPL